ncbi:dihydrodipicolinate synthase family protein, partial [Campylobacter jejuni]|uniref:dihydrodipicolinate synthase family protein n=1 Tax=Campylobacter jejuni TaxID=197 RepID=UPI00163A79D3
ALSLKFIEKVSKLDNDEGITDSSGDALLLNQIIDVVPRNFDVFVGREEFYVGALLAGVKGSMTSIGGVFPELMSEIYKSINEKNIGRALLIQKSLLKAIRFGMSIAFPMGFALLLKARGFEFVNASIHPLSPATKEELNTRFDEAKELIKTIEKETGIKL